MACVAFLTPSILLFALLGALRRPSIHHDGVGYYAPLASVLVDGDLDLRNELVHLGPRFLRAAFMTPDGKLGDPFPVGPALLWAPAVWIASRLPANSLWDAPLAAPSQTAHPAFAPRFVRALLWADMILVLEGGCALAIVLSLGLGWMRAAAAVLAVVFGTPVFYYTLSDPSYGHAASFFAASLFVAAVWLDRRRRLPPELLGFLLGGLILMRSQDAIWGVLLVPRLLETWRDRKRWDLLRFLWPTLVAFLPQALFWQRIYGRALLVPPGPDFLPWWKPQLLQLLASTWNGVLPWSPILLLGLVAWFAVPEKSLRLAVFTGSVLALYSSSILLDWWGGAAFGPRRLVAMAPVAAIGLAHVLRRRPSWALALTTLLVLLCALEIRLAQYKLRGLLPANPGNAADYVRHYPPGSPRALRYGHWDYARLVSECLDAERWMRTTSRPAP